MDEDDLVDYQHYINLYRFYVLDLSKQPELTTYRTANIRLDFELNETTPQNNTTTVKCSVILRQKVYVEI